MDGELFQLPAGRATEAQPIGPLRQLAEAGKRMRDLQRAYFKNRDRSVLIASKKAEREFDAMLAAILGKEPTA